MLNLAFQQQQELKAKQQTPLYAHLIFIHAQIQTDRNAVPIRAKCGNEASTVFLSTLAERVNIVIVSMVTIRSTMARIFQDERELRQRKKGLQLG